MLFQKQKSSNRMRAQPDKARDPTPKDPAQAFGLVDPRQQPDDAFLLLRTHHPRLDHIHGAADRGRDKAGQEARREMSRQIVFRGRMLQHGALEAVVAGELRRGHQHGAHAVGPHAAEEAAPAFFARHAYQAVEGVFVVAAVGVRERGVVLHADVEHVGWVAGYAAQETGCGGHGDEGGEGGRGFGGCEGFLEFFVDAEASCAVGQLAEEGGGELELEKERVGLAKVFSFFFSSVFSRGLRDVVMREGFGCTYTVIETQKGVITQYVHKSAEHAFRVIGGAGLESDLLMVSLGVVSLG